MKKIIAAFMFLLAGSCTYAQTQTATHTRAQLNENTIVKDSADNIYPYKVWQEMVSSGEYSLRTKQAYSDTAVFYLHKLSPEQRQARFNSLPKPAESAFFTTGETITLFKATDINGKKINPKDLVGKTVVLNFWFIGCPPCRKEIPELNKMALAYANDPNVVFVAVALDQRSEIQDFIKTSPFAYHIIDDGRYYANQYKIHLFPTNVVVDKEGKVRFHSSGYGQNTVAWIDKTIKEVQ